jgi:hypothetical protein
METINITPDKSRVDFHQARISAVGKAGETLKQPVIIAWKDDDKGQLAPEIPGGATDRWQDYGENFGGKLEINVGEHFHFIFTEATDFDEPDINVATLTEQDGTSILCSKDACTEQEKQKLGYFAGGGIGG